MSTKSKLLNIQSFITDKIGYETDLTNGVKALAESGVKPLEIESYTTIYSGNYEEAKTSYTLSQSWRNFDGIKITWSADSIYSSYHSFSYFDKAILEYIYDDNRFLMLQKPNKNWYGQYILTDDTTITRDNGQWDCILKIEGFNYNRAVVDFDLLTECVYSETSYNLPSNWNEYERLVCVICSPNGYTAQTEIPHIINVNEFVTPIFTQRQSTFNTLDFDGDIVTLRGGGSTNTRIYGVNHE